MGGPIRHGLFAATNENKGEWRTDMHGNFRDVVPLSECKEMEMGNKDREESKSVAYPSPITEWDCSFAGGT